MIFLYELPLLKLLLAPVLFYMISGLVISQLHSRCSRCRDYKVNEN
ncbi:MAG: hypothetical protein ACJA13_003905 [Paraglaciecola sp.]|jgi:hypothetical protein